MTTLFLHENAYQRIKKDIQSMDADLNIVLMKSDSSLHDENGLVEPGNIKPDVAWYSVDVLLSGLSEKYFELVGRAGTVKWLQSFMAGLDLPIYKKLFRQGVRITRSNAQAIAIAEYVLANVLALYQGAFKRRELQKAHEYRMTGFRELWHTTWLIVGLGNIGQEIARRVRAFEGEVIGVRRASASDPLAREVISLERLPEFLPRADVVVLSCALNQQTEGLANRAFFSQMKENSTLVNIARGKIVDQEDLIEALRAGRPTQAILDVFDPEPLDKESPLWDMDNVIITPHSSSAGNGTMPRGDRLFLDNLTRFLRGETLINETGF